MAVFAMEIALVANPAKAVLKAVAMDVLPVVRVVVMDVVVADVVDEAEIPAIARLARSASASTPKASLCSRMPTSKAQTRVHWNPRAKSNVRIAGLAPSAATGLVVVASARIPQNAVNLALRADRKGLRQPTAALRAATPKAKPVNPAKAAVDGVVAVAGVRAKTARRAMRAARAASPSRALGRAKPPPFSHL